MVHSDDFQEDSFLAAWVVRYRQVVWEDTVYDLEPDIVVLVEMVVFDLVAPVDSKILVGPVDWVDLAVCLAV